MEKQKTWKLQEQNSEDLLTQLLSLRGCKTEAERNLFLNPPHPQAIAADPVLAGLEGVALSYALSVVSNAISGKRVIFVHGDYDVDGICATALIWKAIYQDLGYKNCLPFIPNRFDHGYGLSKESIDGIVDLLENSPTLPPQSPAPLLITVDCGITSFKEVEYAKEKGFEVLILDHHVKPEKLPDCKILWTDKLCAAGIAWIFAQSLLHPSGEESGHPTGGYMDLAALATVADVQPLVGVNRSLVKYGLEEITRTQNIGLKELLKAAGIDGRKVGTFEVGWILAPRLNASGRLEEALSSLRLLCTSSSSQAAEIAQNLNAVNSKRQELTRSMVEMAKLAVGENPRPVNVVVHEDFHEGVIGLVAGKLASHYKSPAVVIRKGEEFSKASARSVSGFNIVEFLRSLGDHFENVGGHAGAAGFTIRTDRIEAFIVAVSEKVKELVLPRPVLELDAKLEFTDLCPDTLEQVRKLEPFGLGNPEPVFLLQDATIVGARNVGSRNQHLKIKISSGHTSDVIGQASHSSTIDCIGFDMGKRIMELVSGDRVNLFFSLSEDTFSGYSKISLRLKDLEKVS